MKMSDDAMEAVLRRLRPAALPLELAERMERPAAVRRRVVPFVGIGLAAAVAIVAGGLIWQRVGRGPGGDRGCVIDSCAAADREGCPNTWGGGGC